MSYKPQIGHGGATLFSSIQLLFYNKKWQTQAVKQDEEWCQEAVRLFVHDCVIVQLYYQVLL